MNFKSFFLLNKMKYFFLKKWYQYIPTVLILITRLYAYLLEI